MFQPAPGPVGRTGGTTRPRAGPPVSLTTVRGCGKEAPGAGGSRLDIALEAVDFLPQAPDLRLGSLQGVPELVLLAEQLVGLRPLLALAGQPLLEPGHLRPEVFRLVGRLAQGGFQARVLG